MKNWMKRTAAGTLAAVILAGTLFVIFGFHSEAKKSEYDDDDFEIEAELSLSPSSEAYEIHIEISNDGPDFEGTVRIIPENSYNATCAYDTSITLSEGSTKQFTLQIPYSSIALYNNYGRAQMLHVILLDDKGYEVTSEKFAKLFDSYQKKVLIGVLSDAYQELAYLDMNGYAAYIINDNYQVEPMELAGDTLADQLDGLDYLVIDQYDTSQLGMDTVKAIEDWVDQGGMLIFGTGEYAYEVLGGFDSGFLQTTCLGIWHEDTWDFTSNQRGDMYTVTGAVSAYDYYGTTPDMYLAADEVDSAILAGFSVNDGNYHYGYSCYGTAVSSGRGSITYVYYALSDPEVAAACARDYYVVENMLEYAADEARIEYSSFHQDNVSGIGYSYYVDQALGIIDMEKSNLNYGILKAIIIIYVILVGPVVYLILRHFKKRELYWAAVPAMALLFVLIISIAGSGFRIADITVCSVTYVNAGGKGETGSILYAYSAGHDDWRAALNDEQTFAGPLRADSGYTNDPLDYYYHVVSDRSNISIGIRPTSSFETAAFQCRSDEAAEGELFIEDLEVKSSSLRGTLTNHTGYDFSYVMVYQNGKVCIIESVKDGEELDLHRAGILRRNDVSSLDEVFWRTADYFYDNERDKSIASAISAAYITLVRVADYGDTVVIGVTPDYERVTEGNCKETSYGCFYCIAN